MVLLISYVCGIVLTEPKLLQVLWNRSLNRLLANSGFKTQLKPMGTKIGKYCGIVSVELKLLQVVCNRLVVLKPRGKKVTYSGGQKAPLKVKK